MRGVGRLVPCPACQGHMRAAMSAAGELVYNGEPCKLCGAKGRVPKAQAEAWVPPRPWATCALCGADKGLHAADCSVLKEDW